MKLQDDHLISLDEEDDDRPIGRVLSRREALVIFGAAAAATFLAACGTGASTTASLIAPATASPTAAATSAPASTSAASPTSSAAATAAAATTLPSCVVVPAETEGPYFVDEKLNRSDIRPDTADGSVQGGIPLALSFVVSKVSGGSCVAFADALVDIWHCNALGVYSDVSQQSSVGHTFLRGYQVTNSNGRAAFTTIYPGWYQGRAVHIHFKIRTEAGAAQGLEFTSQLFFDDTLSDKLFALTPYSQKGTRDTRNGQDSIYPGEVLLLNLSGDSTTGYAGTFQIGVTAS